MCPVSAWLSRSPRTASSVDRAGAPYFFLLKNTRVAGADASGRGGWRDSFAESTKSWTPCIHAVIAAERDWRSFGVFGVEGVLDIRPSFDELDIRRVNNLLGISMPRPRVGPERVGSFQGGLLNCSEALAVPLIVRSPPPAFFER